MGLTGNVKHEPTGDDAWLELLPYDENVANAATEGVEFSAFLVGAPAGHVRFLLWPLLLEFRAADVIRIEELMVSAEARLARAIAVDVVLRTGAPLMALKAAETLPTTALGAAVPFSLATRPTPLVLPPAPQYTAALTDYLRRYGLEPGS